MYKEKYIFEYLNEDDFRKKERSLRKYNMLAYKKLCFEYYPELKSGKFLGTLESKTENEKKYVLKLPTDKMFTMVHGELKLCYSVYEKEKTIVLENIMPEDILLEGHSSNLSTYKGVVVSKNHIDKDMFKINLLNMLNKYK